MYSDSLAKQAEMDNIFINNVPIVGNTINSANRHFDPADPQEQTYVVHRFVGDFRPNRVRTGRSKRNDNEYVPNESKQDQDMHDGELMLLQQVAKMM